MYDEGDYMAQVREDTIRAICPTIYMETEQARLNQERLQSVMAWQYGATGLLLAGNTGTGKTRCAWELIKRLIREGRKVTAFDGMGWGIAVSAAFGEPSRTDQWVSAMCKCDVLFIDDLFKAKMTEAQELAIYGVFERRGAWKKPIICTTNTSGAAIMERMTDAGREDRMRPLLRRMSEFCQIITFNGGQGEA